MKKAAKSARWAAIARPAVLDAFYRGIRFSLDGSLSFHTLESMALSYSLGGESMFPTNDCELMDDPVRGPLVEVRAAIEALVRSGNLREVTDPVALVANAEYPKYSRAVRQIRRFVFQYGDPIDMKMDASVEGAYPRVGLE